MSTTVIFSNMGDTDTAVLKYIWQNLPNCKVVEVNKSTVGAKDLVNEAIEKEHDTLIFAGHGTPYGLLNPSWKGGTFLIDRSNYKKINCSRVIGIWCHAREFAESVGLRGFFSSMFISNSGEARMNGYYKTTDKTITEQEILFGIRLNELIANYVPMKKWVATLNEQADKSIDIVKFNYDGLRYYKKPVIVEQKYPSYYSSLAKYDDVDHFTTARSVYGGIRQTSWYDDDDWYPEVYGADGRRI